MFWIGVPPLLRRRPPPSRHIQRKQDRVWRWTRQPEAGMARMGPGRGRAGGCPGLAPGVGDVRVPSHKRSLE